MDFKTFILNELSRYSAEVNFRSNHSEVSDAFAKIALGYVSAAVKQDGFHIKRVYDEKPIRIMISTRNWDDGEWIVGVMFNTNIHSFVISKGFYNKDRKTMSVQSTQKCKGSNAADITMEVKEVLRGLKNQPDKRLEPLHPAKMTPGPKG